MVECVNVVMEGSGLQPGFKEKGGVGVSKTAKFSILNYKLRLRTTSVTEVGRILVNSNTLYSMASCKKGEEAAGNFTG